MGTVVAIESERGIGIASDTRAVDGGTVTGERDSRVLALDDVGVGVVGSPGDVQAFQRQVELEFRRERLERDDDPDVDEFARVAARRAEAVGVDAVVGARDPEGIARLREVRADGRVLEATDVALGSGAQVAYGRLEDLDAGTGDDPGALARDVVGTVIERDTATGGEVDVWTLENETGVEGP